jgi:hypothetical protein
VEQKLYPEAPFDFTVMGKFGEPLIHWSVLGITARDLFKGVEIPIIHLNVSNNAIGNEAIFITADFALIVF